MSLATERRDPFVQGAQRFDRAHPVLFEDLQLDEERETADVLRVEHQQAIERAERFLAHAERAHQTRLLVEELDQLFGIVDELDAHARVQK